MVLPDADEQSRLEQGVRRFSVWALFVIPQVIADLMDVSGIEVGLCRGVPHPDTFSPEFVDVATGLAAWPFILVVMVGAGLQEPQLRQDIAWIAPGKAVHDDRAITLADRQAWRLVLVHRTPAHGHPAVEPTLERGDDPQHFRARGVSGQRHNSLLQPPPLPLRFGRAIWRAETNWRGQPRTDG